MAEVWPNILIFMDDEHHAGCLSCTDRPQVKTPHLDGLAEQGVLFERSYSCGPECVPSRISLLTGMYPHSHGVYSYSGGKPTDIPAGTVSLPNYLKKELGYRTGLVGKEHFGKWAVGPFDNSGEGKGSSYKEHLIQAGMEALLSKAGKGVKRDYTSYESPIPYEHSEPVWVADKAMEWIGQNGDKPFFMWCCFDAPHPPLSTPGDCPVRYDPDAIDLSQILHTSAEDRRLLLQRPGSSRYGCEDAWNIKISGEDKYRQALAHYYGLISMVDCNVGRIIEFLKNNGLLDNTIILFTSDHGDFAGEYGMIGKNASGAFEAIYRVPMIWYWQGHFGTQRIHSFVEHVDSFPTLCDLLGVDSPPQVQGESYADVLRWSGSGPGPAPQTKEMVFFDDSFTKGVRTRRYQLTYHFDGSEWAELYDLQTDPLERINLFDNASYAQIRQKLLCELLKWHISTEQPIGWSAYSQPHPPFRWYREHPDFKDKLIMNKARISSESSGKELSEK